jgi:hypothetical protein
MELQGVVKTKRPPYKPRVLGFSLTVGKRMSQSHVFSSYSVRKSVNDGKRNDPNNYLEGMYAKRGGDQQV